MGEVIRFPVERRQETITPDQQRSCFNCVNGMFGARGTYCMEFKEVIFSEVLAASDCEAYDSTEDDVG